MYTGIITIFCLGYAAIIFETFLRLNRAAVALIMAVLCWLVYFSFTSSDTSMAMLSSHLSGVAQIIFFLFGAMTIVELIDSHQGFKIVTDLIGTTSRRKMLWLLIVVSFFLSAVLDNLTSMIVMISLLRKLIQDNEDRWLIGSMLVIAVNAGGAWTPIGDVTTTMLWIGHQITTWQTMKMLFFPSLVCILVSGLIATFFMKKDENVVTTLHHQPMEPAAKWVFFLGIGALLMVPVFKALFNLPPFMGILIGLGALWFITDFIHYRHGEDRVHLRVPHVLSRLDLSGILFFLGILLAIAALDSVGILNNLALFLDKVLPNLASLAMIIGLLSSIIDNVPIVAATMGMYDLQTYPTDSSFWQLVAYSAGTGGSILIIGSAAGVAFMGIEKIDFIWYLKKVSLIALAGYLAGFAVYFLQQIPFLP